MFIEYRSAFMDKYCVSFMNPRPPEPCICRFIPCIFSVFAPSVIGSGDDDDEFKKGIAETITKAVDGEFKPTSSSTGLVAFDFFLIYRIRYNCLYL